MTMSPPASVSTDVTKMTTFHSSPPSPLTRWGIAVPTVRAPTRMPSAEPRPRTNQVAMSLSAGGYTPARKNPVMKRSGIATPALSTAEIAEVPLGAKLRDARRCREPRGHRQNEGYGKDGEDAPAPGIRLFHAKARGPLCRRGPSHRGQQHLPDLQSSS